MIYYYILTLRVLCHAAVWLSSFAWLHRVFWTPPRCTWKFFTPLITWPFCIWRSDHTWIFSYLEFCRLIWAHHNLIGVFQGLVSYLFYGNVPKYFLRKFQIINNFRIDWEFGTTQSHQLQAYHEYFSYIRSYKNDTVDSSRKQINHIKTSIVSAAYIHIYALTQRHVYI